VENRAYDRTSHDDLSPPSMRPNRNGHENRAYIQSQISDSNGPSSPHIYTIPVKEGMPRSNNNYAVSDNDSDGGCLISRTRLCAAIGVGLLLVVLIVAIILGLYFGKLSSPPGMSCLDPPLRAYPSPHLLLGSGTTEKPYISLFAIFHSALLVVLIR